MMSSRSAVLLVSSTVQAELHPISGADYRKQELEAQLFVDEQLMMMMRNMIQALVGGDRETTRGDDKGVKRRWRIGNNRETWKAECYENSLALTAKIEERRGALFVYAPSFSLGSVLNYLSLSFLRDRSFPAPFYCGLDSPLAQTPRADPFSIQSIKTMEAKAREGER